MTYVGIDVSKATFVVAYSSAKTGRTKTEEKNIALSALHWIDRDFKEKFGDADTPHTKKMRKETDRRGA